MMSNIKWIDEVDIQNKRVLLLVDYNVKLSPDFKIDSNERILRPLPTIKYLLKKRNKLILISHLGQPKEKEEKKKFPRKKKMKFYFLRICGFIPAKKIATRNLLNNSHHSEKYTLMMPLAFHIEIMPL